MAYPSVGSAGYNPVVTLRLETNQGRSLIYKDRTVSDDAGRYVFRVPYSTDPGAEVVALGAYELTIGIAGGRRLGSAEVTDSDVREGREVVVRTLK